MPSRESQTVILSRQTILLVTAVGVGLLTLCYVLGVQVGKQSAALRHPAARGAGEDLQELPASVADQLKALEDPSAADAEVSALPPAPAAAAGPKPSPPPAPGPPGPKPGPPAGPAGKVAVPVEVRMPPAPKDTDPPAEKKAAEPAHWTLQLVSTPDQAEAQRMVTRAKGAGFPAAVIQDKGLFKVRLIQPGSREAVDATAQKLKNRGFKPFPMKIN